MAAARAASGRRGGGSGGGASCGGSRRQRVRGPAPRHELRSSSASGQAGEGGGAGGGLGRPGTHQGRRGCGSGRGKRPDVVGRRRHEIRGAKTRQGGRGGKSCDARLPPWPWIHACPGGEVPCCAWLLARYASNRGGSGLFLFFFAPVRCRCCGSAVVSITL